MADEITITSNMELSNGAVVYQPQTQQFTADQSTAEIIINVQTIGTSAEAVELGDIATPGWARFHNLDPTNFVQVGVDDGGGFVPFMKVLPGEIQGPVRIDPTHTLQAKADTGSCKLKTEICAA